MGKACRLGGVPIIEPESWWRGKFTTCMMPTVFWLHEDKDRQSCLPNVSCFKGHEKTYILRTSILISVNPSDPHLAIQPEYANQLTKPVTQAAHNVTPSQESNFKASV